MCWTSEPIEATDSEPNRNKQNHHAVMVSATRAGLSRETTAMAI